MAQLIGKAGASANSLAVKRELKRQWILLIVIGLLLLLMYGILKVAPQIRYLPKSMSLYVALFLFFLFVGAMKWVARKGDRAERHLRKRRGHATRGAAGEVKVANLLEELPDSYVVSHDLVQRAGDIDHIVVGPTGIFVIETKAHGGQVTAEGDHVLVNGRPPEKDFIAQCWRNAYSLQNWLKESVGLDVRVTPVLVFANAFVHIRKPVKGVQVVNKGYLLQTITRQRAVDLPVERIAESLRVRLGSQG